MLTYLKQWCGKSAYHSIGFRDITIRLKSGQSWDVHSPVFLRSKSKGKRGRSAKRQEVCHLGLELLGIINRISPALAEICVSMSVLCPSFEVAANALRGLGISMNDHLLQNITIRFSKLAKTVRVACHEEDVWQKPGIRILICVDGGRIRERCKKRGQRKKGLKRQGYKTEWFEPRLLIISQFDNEGKKIKSINPILDGSCGSLGDFGSASMHAENIIFLRSLVLTGKLKNACKKALSVVRNMFDNNTIGDLPMVA